ncbi:hypothetical protein JD77_05966 [Micromonospora olivasterospora]|uniref:5-formyltetrahydrofolate cyclo-ligase n=1 Tax=Micromonospora olivasterospora TaxID=1880 RepID=A0A562IIV1_MICOL|nr:hypothetical protein JD77_05966 [Micromonospora olivasterospora]
MAKPDGAKNEVRHRVWDLLTEHRAAQPDVHGSIPDFVGAELAAQKLAELPVWKQARVVKAVPDKPQLPVRRERGLLTVALGATGGTRSRLLREGPSARAAVFGQGVERGLRRPRAVRQYPHDPARGQVVVVVQVAGGG